MIGRRPAKAAAQVIGAALLFSTGGAAIKGAAVSAMYVASIRSGIAALTLLLWLRGRVSCSPRIAAVAAVYAATLVLFVSSTKLTTAATAIFLQSSAPILIAVLAPALLGEKSRRSDLIFLLAAAAGLALCMTGTTAPTAIAPDPATGNVLGALCSVSWALTLMGLRSFERSAPGTSMSAVVMGNTFAFAAGLPTLFSEPTGSAADWAAMAYLGVFQVGLAYVLLTAAFRTLPALHVSLLLLIEPVLNPVWAWVFFGEVPAAGTLAGGTLILSAAAAQAIQDARTSNQPLRHQEVATKGTKIH